MKATVEIKLSESTTLCIQSNKNDSLEECLSEIIGDVNSGKECTTNNNYNPTSHPQLTKLWTVRE